MQPLVLEKKQAGQLPGRFIGNPAVGVRLHSNTVTG